MTFLFSKRKAFCRFSVLMLGVLGCFAVSYAQEIAETEQVQNLPPIVVTASRIKQLQSEALPHTTVITEEDIRNRQPQDALALLRQEAGIDIVQTGGFGSATSLYMRGANANQFLVLLDGIPIRDVTATGTAAPLQHVLPEQIERIEISRGNVSAVYGSGAIGGVIQIFTKRRKTDTPAINLSLEGGSRGTSKINAGISGCTENTKYALSATRYGTSGFSAMNAKQYVNENPDKDRDRNYSISGMLSHEWMQGQEIGARFYGNDAKFDYDNGGEGPKDRIDKGVSRQKTFSVFTKNRITENWLSNLTLSFSDLRRKDRSYGGYYGDGNSSFKSKTFLAQWHNEIDVIPDWTLSFGADGAHEKADVLNYDPAPWFGKSAFVGSRNTASSFIGINGKYGSHELQANVRYDYVKGSGSDVTWYLGYGYNITDRFKIIGSYSSAFLAPTMYQQYHPIYGNPNLKAEKARSHEVGLQYSDGNILARAVLFDTRTRNMIDFDSSGSGWSYVNTKKARTQGIELSLRGKIIYDIGVRASLTLQNPKDVEKKAWLKRRARTMASLGLDKTWGSLYVGADVSYGGHRWDSEFVNYSEVDLSSYWLANFYIRYQITKNLSVYGRIENMFKREYQTVFGYNQTPRGFFIGAEWRM